MMDEVIGEESTWSSSSVGRLQVTMKKKETPKYWKNLFQDNSDMPNNVKIWFEMREKFSDELQTFIDDHEDEQEREEEERNQENRRKRTAERKKKKSINDSKNEVKTASSDL